jgi:hypothetical protein
MPAEQLEKKDMSAEDYIKQQQGFLRQLLWLLNASRIGELHTLKVKEDKK